ncbi:hypothetical protein [Ralstonia sp. ASV6]|uniref:hypothetical protein n=1 Tax=Ralstonia sp. ASV6 TaxID=2795124 RepID=UPI0018EB1B33
MQAPIDLSLEVFRTQLQTALHTLTTLEETQERALKITLKGVEDAERRALQACASVSEATNWEDLAALPAILLQTRIEQSSRLFQTILSMVNEQQNALLQQATTSAEAWRTLATHWGDEPMIAPVRALFGALRATELQGMPQTLQPSDKKKASAKHAEPAAPAV